MEDENYDLEPGDLSPEAEKIYYHAFEARSNVNYILESLDRYSKAAPEERAEIEGEVESRQDILETNLEVVESQLENLEECNLSEADETAYTLLTAYHRRTEELHSEIEPEKEFSSEVEPEELDPRTRGNYDEIFEKEKHTPRNSDTYW